MGGQTRANKRWAEVLDDDLTLEEILDHLERSKRNPFLRPLPKERLTREEFALKYPHHGGLPPMKSVSDVISTLQLIIESASENSTESLATKEEAALAAEVLGEVALYTLTIHTGTASSEASFARLVTRHFARFGTTQQSLKSLLNIFVATRQLNSSEKSE
jgi:hypothetical protein